MNHISRLIYDLLSINYPAITQTDCEELAVYLLANGDIFWNPVYGWAVKDVDLEAEFNAMKAEA